jgi:hypothetical protein
LPAILTTPVLEELVVLPETRTVVVPLPMPEPPPVTSSQVTVLLALQIQLALAVTATLIDSPVATAVRVSGEILFAQPPDAGCVTAKVWPAIVSEVLRSAPLVLAATVSVTVPLPLPLLPFAMVIHEAVLVAVQSQVVAAVTDTVVVSPPASAVLLAGLIE